MPLSIWALLISLSSFIVASAALIWQVFKHFLDGGRVKVYLNTAIWNPEFMIATRQSGHFSIPNDDKARQITHGHALELAQLVVENPGRSALTIHSPGLVVQGHEKRKYTIVPRRFSTGDNFGHDKAIDEAEVRLEPYDRVTFLLDCWSLVPGLLDGSRAGSITLRGAVRVAGKSHKVQKSRWRRRWVIRKGTYTAIEGSPKFTPFSVLWRELYLRLPDRDEVQSDSTYFSERSVTRGQVHFLLGRAMAQFTSKPKREELGKVLDELAANQGDRLPMLGTSLFDAYDALERMEDHLTPWEEGLIHKRRAD